MKILNSHILLSSILLSGFILSPASAAENDTKCYVEYTGGGNGIQFIDKKVRLNKANQILSNKRVYDGFSKKKRAVYKVIECVAISGTFKLGAAQILDNNTPR